MYRSERVDPLTVGQNAGRLIIKFGQEVDTRDSTSSGCLLSAHLDRGALSLKRGVFDQILEDACAKTIAWLSEPHAE